MQSVAGKPAALGNNQTLIIAFNPRLHRLGSASVGKFNIEFEDISYIHLLQAHESDT